VVGAEDDPGARGVVLGQGEAVLRHEHMFAPASTAAELPDRASGHDCYFMAVAETAISLTRLDVGLEFARGRVTVQAVEDELSTLGWLVTVAEAIATGDVRRSTRVSHRTLA
jgi:hypothetical protein